MWAVAALALAMVMAPLYVTACRSLARLTARNAHRLIATQRGTLELERLRAGGAVGAFTVSELPDGRGTAEARDMGNGLREIHLDITWSEDGIAARSEWLTRAPVRRR